MRIIITLQAVYYLVTGMWPVFDMDTFEAVTGPKIDDWLVKMVGLLAATIGLGLLAGNRKVGPSREILVLSVAAAVSFAAIDVVYAANGTISKIYLVDAALQAWFMAGLTVATLTRRGPIKRK